MLIYIAIYLAGFIVIPAFDALIGFGDALEGDEAPPLVLVCIFSPLFLPIILLLLMLNFFHRVKSKRITRQIAKKRQRLEEEKEQQRILISLEEEFEEESPHPLRSAALSTEERYSQRRNY